MSVALIAHTATILDEARRIAEHKDLPPSMKEECDKHVLRLEHLYQEQCGETSFEHFEQAKQHYGASK